MQRRTGIGESSTSYAVARMRLVLILVVAFTALAVSVGGASAIVPPTNCGMQTVSGKRYQIKADGTDALPHGEDLLAALPLDGPPALGLPLPRLLPFDEAALPVREGRPHTYSRSGVERTCARLRAALAGTLAVLVVGGCGGQSTERQSAGRSARLVDFSKKPPYVNALDIDPATGDFLLTTNRGLWQWSPTPTPSRPCPHVGRAAGQTTMRRSSSCSSPVLRELISSGHCNQDGALPSFLGSIASDDRRRNWKIISPRSGSPTYKIIIKRHRLYAFDTCSARC